MSICPFCEVMNEYIRTPVHACPFCRTGRSKKEIKKAELDYYCKDKPVEKTTTTLPYKLCYVEGNFAYFTTKSLRKQWGDGWGNRPYEHNSGLPYDPSKSASTSKEHFDKMDKTYCRKVKDYMSSWSGKEYCMVEFSEYDKNDEPLWRITKIAFDGGFDQPKEGHSNSPYSVEDINKGNVAWLISIDKEVGIFAGCSIPEFIEKIISKSGKIYLPYGEDL